MGSPDLVLYDATEGGFLGWSWRTYARTFPGSVGVGSWSQTADVLRLSKTRHVQLWGHGRTAAPLIDGQPPPDLFPWHLCRSIWFRSCSVANGQRGRAFMLRVGHSTDAAAHLGIIGTWGMHSRLVGVRKGRRPWWGDTDPQEQSSPFVPRTVPATARSLPRWTFAVRSAN